MTPTIRNKLLQAGVVLGCTVAPVSLHAALTIPDYPLFLTSTGVAPNVVMTFDDSGSMRRGWAPESVSSDQATIDGPRFKSPSVNGLYYNPRITYSIPTRSDGTPYSTSFGSAYFNGFDTSKGSGINLGASYKVIGQSTPSHAYSACTDTLIVDNRTDCRLVKHPGTTTTTTHTATCTNVFFDRRNRNDRITINGTGTGCSSLFSGIPDDTNVTVTNAGSYSGTYTVASGRSGNEISITQSFPADYTDPSATLTWTSTSSSAGNTNGTAAYYYLYYTDFAPEKAIPTRPAGCDDSRANDSCYIRVNVASTGTTGDIAAGNATAQQQNFANWYSFYRTRAMAVMSGAMTAVTGLTNGSVRLGWQTINECTSFGTDCDGYTSTNSENRLRTLSSTYKTNFYNWLQRFPVEGTTPLRSAMKRAGDYFATSGTNSPYAQDPYVTQGTELACRKNFHVMFTDGLWNSETYSVPGGNSNPDSSGSISLPDGKTYSPMTPFQDVSNTVGLGSTYTNTNNLADTAMYYWAKDLRTTLDNDVPPRTVDRSGSSTAQYWNAKNDPATWQHMVNYTIGLGLSASLVPECYYNPDTPTDDPNNPDPGCPVWGGNMYSGDYTALVGGSVNWPKTNTNPPTNAEPDGHVYDLWHAAINSRGKFYSADNPGELVAAFVDVMNTISSAAAAGGGAGLSASSSTIQTRGGSTILYQAQFDADWSGRLEALPFQGADGSLGTAYWNAAMLMPAHADRNIFTHTGSAGAEFLSCTSLSASQQTALGSGTTCTDRLNWLRGDYSKEQRNGGSLRNRIWSISANDLRDRTDLYPYAFKEGRCVRDADGTLYQDSLKSTYTYSPPAVASETFSCPWVLGDIVNSDLVYAKDEDFGYAAGSVTFTGHDSYAAYVSGKAAKTAVVFAGANDGMMHAFRADTGNADSGKELFAYVPAGVYANLSTLTDPGYDHKFYVNGPATLGDAYIGGWKTFLVGGLGAGGKSIYALDVSDPANFSASHVKWEFSDANDLGLTYGKPLIAPVKNGTGVRWAAIFGNGYNSTSDKAFLFIVDLSDGSLIKKLAAGSSTANGLSIPYLLDSDGDKVVDAVYAGDLKGNLWKFDLSSTSSGSWSVGNGGNALFAATNSASEIQPITTQPVVAAHPSGGWLIYVGTGSYITGGDLTSDDEQSFYAFWDNLSTSTAKSRSSLLEQTITLTPTQSGKYLRVTSDLTPDWGTHRGWFIDLPFTAGSPSERVIHPALMIDRNPDLYDRVIYTTVIPSADPCSQGGTGWLMEMDLVTGGRPNLAVYDISGDSAFGYADWYGATDSNGDGTISKSEAEATGKTVTGQKFDVTLGVPGETTLISYVPPSDSAPVDPATDDGTSGESRLYKCTPGSNPGVPVCTPQPEVPGSGGGGGAPVRVYWQQIL